MRMGESPRHAMTRLVGLLLALMVTVFCFTLLCLESVPDRIISSIGILAALLGIGYLYGWLSIASIIASVCYIPSLAFFYAWINKADYINFMNHWLQDDIYFVNYAVFFSFVSLASTYVVLLSFRIRLLSARVMLTVPCEKLSMPFFVVITFLAGFFFWLAEPGGTIITTSYADILEQRYEGTQFAGALGLLCWLMAYMTYLSAGQQVRMRRSFFWGRKIFIFVTVFSVLWLLFHARRSELAGMFILLVLVVAEKKGLRRALIYLGVVLAALTIVGKIRTVTLLGAFFGSMSSAKSISISSLPGGASNIFMSFVDVLHYFSTHTLLYGETFVNYFLQVLPTNIYGLVGIEKPPYFHEYGIFDGYEWNGGVNGMSIFYANFGLVGSILYGILVGIYIFVATRSLMSQQLIPKVIGSFLVAIAFRGFWYDFITIIKPVVFLLAVHVVLYKSNGLSLCRQK